MNVRRWFVHRLKSALDRYGVQVCRVSNPSQSNWDGAFSSPLPVEPFMLLLLDRISDPFFIQIGAHDGISYDDLFAVVSKHNLRGIVVEPLRDLYLQLCENYRSIRHVVAANVAVDVRNGCRDIYRVPLARAVDFESGIGSFSSSHHRLSGVKGEKIEAEAVNCLTFESLCEMYEVARVDYLQIDAEGYDGKILLSIDLSRWMPSIIRFEHASLCDEEKGEIVKRLESLGYDLFRDRENCFAVHERLRAE